MSDDHQSGFSAPRTESVKHPDWAEVDFDHIELFPDIQSSYPDGHLFWNHAPSSYVVQVQIQIDGKGYQLQGVEGDLVGMRRENVIQQVGFVRSSDRVILALKRRKDSGGREAVTTRRSDQFPECAQQPVVAWQVLSVGEIPRPILSHLEWRRKNEGLWVVKEQRNGFIELSEQSPFDDDDDDDDDGPSYPHHAAPGPGYPHHGGHAPGYQHQLAPGYAGPAGAMPGYSQPYGTASYPYGGAMQPVPPPPPVPGTPVPGTPGAVYGDPIPPSVEPSIRSANGKHYFDRSLGRWVEVPNHLRVIPPPPDEAPQAPAPPPTPGSEIADIIKSLLKSPEALGGVIAALRPAQPAPAAQPDGIAAALAKIEADRREERAEQRRLEDQRRIEEQRREDQRREERKQEEADRREERKQEEAARRQEAQRQHYLAQGFLLAPDGSLTPLPKEKKPDPLELARQLIDKDARQNNPLAHFKQIREMARELGFKPPGGDDDEAPDSAEGWERAVGPLSMAVTNFINSQVARSDAERKVREAELRAEAERKAREAELKAETDRRARAAEEAQRAQAQTQWYPPQWPMPQWQPPHAAGPQTLPQGMPQWPMPQGMPQWPYPYAAGPQSLPQGMPAAHAPALPLDPPQWHVPQAFPSPYEAPPASNAEPPAVEDPPQHETFDEAEGDDESDEGDETAQPAEVASPSHEPATPQPWRPEQKRFSFDDAKPAAAAAAEPSTTLALPQPAAQPAGAALPARDEKRFVLEIVKEHALGPEELVKRAYKQIEELQASFGAVGSWEDRRFVVTAPLRAELELSESWVAFRVERDATGESFAPMLEKHAAAMLDALTVA